MALSDNTKAIASVGALTTVALGIKAFQVAWRTALIFGALYMLDVGKNDHDRGLASVCGALLAGSIANQRSSRD